MSNLLPPIPHNFLLINYLPHQKFVRDFYCSKNASSNFFHFFPLSKQTNPLSQIYTFKNTSFLLTFFQFSSNIMIDRKLVLLDQTYVLDYQYDTIELFGKSHLVIQPNYSHHLIVIAHDSSSVLVQPNCYAIIIANNKSTIISYGDSLIIARNLSRVFAYKTTYVLGSHLSTIHAFNNSQVLCVNLSHAQMRDNSYISLSPFRPKNHVELYDNSVFRKIDTTPPNLKDFRVNKHVTPWKKEVNVLCYLVQHAATPEELRYKIKQDGDMIIASTETSTMALRFTTIDRIFNFLSKFFPTGKYEKECTYPVINCLSYF